MRVAMYYNNSDIRVEEQDTPKISPDELLVKIHASGVCGSDVLEWYRVPKAPRAGQQTGPSADVPRQTDP